MRIRKNSSIFWLLLVFLLPIFEATLFFEESEVELVFLLGRLCTSFQLWNWLPLSCLHNGRSVQNLLIIVQEQKFRPWR